MILNKGGINVSSTQNVLEYKCPCCGAGLKFSGAQKKLSCEYCDNTFELDAVREYNDSLGQTDQQTISWDDSQTMQWSEEEQTNMRLYICNSCGGEIVTDDTTAATFCPYCENPTVLPGNVSGGLRPDAVIPFKTTKIDAQKAFLNLCKGKRLLPKDFTAKHRLEKISGMYVPFWMYECNGSIDSQYKATRTHHWSDANYYYTKTDHFMLTRGANAQFADIPMDGSSKLDNTIMESIEPFDMTQAVDFNTAYLSGFLADRYDVEAKAGEERIRQRVDHTFTELLSGTFIGYSTVVPTSRQLQVKHSKAKYVLLPVWMLHTKYQDKAYVFAMNGQSGKMTGTLPVDKKKQWSWFFGVAASVAAVISLLQWLVL
jgi:DNA-directed RNA polymerase subunit RPC12/RpoP